MSLRNIFYKLAHDVSRYPNIVQLTNTLDHGFKEVAEHIQDGGSEVEVTPVYTSGEKLATVTVDDVDHEIYMPNGEVKTMEGSSFKTVNGSLLDEMKVGFTPIQSGSGAPSTDNVRPISGHTQVQSKINDTTYTTSLGDTYYGGDVDQVSGEGESDMASIVFDGSADENWNVVAASNRAYIAISDIDTTTPDNTIADIKANIYKPGEYLPPSTPETRITARYNIAQINIFDYTNIGPSTTSADWKTFLSNNPLQIVYKLAAPTALTLTGQNITAEVGENNVSAPGTNQEILEVKYHQMMTIQDIEKLIQ